MDEEIKTIPETSRGENLNPYAYLEGSAFTAEKFKIEIKNLPKFYGIGELRKLLNNKLNLGISKLKTPFKNSSFAFVCFRNDEDKKKALDVLNDYHWKGNTLQALEAKANPDPFIKRKLENAENEREYKIQKFDEDSLHEFIKNSTIPLWNIPYTKQLQQKQERIKNIITRLGNTLERNFSLLTNWMIRQKEDHYFICKLYEIRHASEINEYRNKCEFSIGFHPITKEKTVGFRTGSYSNGFVSVGPLDGLNHVSEKMKDIAKTFQSFINDSKWSVFDPLENSGNFKQLTVRCSPTESMVIVGFDKQELNDSEETCLREELVQFFTTGKGQQLNVTSLYYLPMRRKQTGMGDPTPIHLHGATHIYHAIHDLKFRISPEAFFQINTQGADVLYKSIIELANVNASTTVFDICCGTGTIGLCMAKHCKEVFGVDSVNQAIIDAGENAKENNITNCHFVTGKAEDFITTLLQRTTNEDIVAVVNPPRAGLHKRAITQLRSAKRLNRIVYISCNPDAAFENFVELGRRESKTLHGLPFVPTACVAVDMFPHTKHCELILLFERITQSDLH